MPYTINKYNGAQITVVADGTIDSTLDIKLIGKNYAGYGEVQNENIVFMLENFANNNPPPRAVTGQIWFDSSTSKLKFYDGTKFRTTGGAEVGATAPTGLTTGDFWFDTTNKQLYAWDGAAFVLVGPQGVAGSQTTQMRSRSVRDTSNNPHAIIEAVANGATIFVISQDTEFTLDDSTNAIDGFTKIQQGVTLCYTPGQADPNPGQTTSSHRFWGTSSNSERLGGFDSTAFVRSNNATFSTLVNFADVGYTVGNPQARLKVFNDGDLTPTIRNQSNDTIVFQTTVSGSTKTPFRLVGPDILPGAALGDTDLHDIGSPDHVFNAVYSASFVGTASKADTVNVGGTYRSASIASSPYTIPVRDVNSDIFAAKFQGIATSAYYADLAEKYLPDAEYIVGTVMSIGGEKEVTACSVGDRAIGVISENPAYMMNSGLEGGVYVALKGRVPVKVTGMVLKGQRLVAGQDGTAQAAFGNTADVFAVALESNGDAGMKIVECLIL